MSLRTRLGLTLLASRMLHRKAEMSPGRSLDFLAALDGRAIWGAGLGANKSAIIATGLAMAIRFARQAANFTNAMVLDEGKSQVFFFVKSVEDHVVCGTK